MKRSLNQVRNVEKDSPPRLKRAQTLGEFVAEDGCDPTVLLVHQNRELGMELRKRRREANEVQKQSEFCQAQLSRLEERVGYIDRTWTQFESDMSTLLKSINKKEAVSTPQQNSLLKEFLDTTKTYYESLPASETSLLCIEDSVSVNDVAVAEEFTVEDLAATAASKPIGADLMHRLDSTCLAVKSICNAINCTTGENSSILSVLSQTYAEERAVQAENIPLIEQLTATHKEVFSLQADLSMTQRRLRQTERRLTTDKKDGKVASNTVDGSVMSMPTAVPSLPQESPAAAFVGYPSENMVEKSSGSICNMQGRCQDATAIGLLEGDAGELRALHDETAAEKQLVADTELRLSNLSAQVSEAETRRARAEKSLLDYMAKLEEKLSSESGCVVSGLSHAAVAEVERVTKLVVDMRKSFHKRLIDVQVEKSALVTRLADLHKGMDDITERTEMRLEEICASTEEEVQRARKEKASAVDSLRGVQAQLKQFDAIQLQMTELQALLESTRNRSSQQENRLSSLQLSLQLTEANMSSSCAREQELERLAADAQQIGSRTVTAMRLAQSAVDEEEGIVLEEPSPDERMDHEVGVTLRAILGKAQQRSAEIESELKAAKVGMDNLIMEIEGVAADEDKTRAQHGRLVQQIAETQSMQRGVMQENLRLHQEIAALQEKHAELRQRADSTSALVEQVETAVATARSAEHAVRTELVHVTSLAVERSGEISTQEDTIVDLSERLQATEDAMSSCRKITSILKAKCAGLSEQCEMERKKRMTAERSRVFKTETSVLNCVTDEETTMLDMTLNMLRCSVCKDRFKEVAITRCFHLFCRDCIDESLRNRSRKCPACGEKFGQDDVKQIYFTH